MDATLRAPVERVATCARATPALLLLGGILVSLLLAPYLAGFHSVPQGEGFRGTLWPIDDSAEYLAALREGGQGAWLWHDPFMTRTPPIVLMYTTYLLAGHALTVLGFSVPVGAAILAACSLLALLCALWILAAAFMPVQERCWFVGFALGAGGIYWLDAALAVPGHAPVPVVMLASPSLSGFTMAVLDAHRAQGVAGALIAATAVLNSARDSSHPTRLVLYGVGGMVLLALNMPMLLPLFVPVLCLSALFNSLGMLRAKGSGRATSRALVTATWPAVAAAPFAIYYLLIFKHGAWSNGSMTTVASPPPLEFVLSMGVLLPFAYWGWRHAPARSKPLANLLALWCGLAIAGRLLPLWQSVRLTDGLNVASGALIGLGVLGAVPDIRWRVRLLIFASLGPILYYLLLVSDLGAGRATALYTSMRETLALRWLAAHVASHDVVLAAYRFGNVAPEACGCRVVVGHSQQTLDFAVSYPRVLSFFSVGVTTAARMQILRDTGATLIVYDPFDAPEEHFDPRRLPNARVVYSTAGMSILRVR